MQGQRAPAARRVDAEMGTYDKATYGERAADVYDDWYAGLADTEAAVATLADLARGRRVLELGIGTGRIAVPLAARGVEIQGIDASESMLARLRAKPGGASIPVIVGDFADVEAPGPFSLVFAAFNTFFFLNSQEDQIRCFRNAGKQLAEDGFFLVEVADVTGLTQRQSTQTASVETDRVVLDVARHDPVCHRLVAQHVVIAEDSIRLYPDSASVCLAC